MDSSEKDEDGNYDDLWMYTSWEKECIDEAESVDTLEARLPVEREQAAQRLWVSFQNAAAAVTQLYKERQQCGCGHSCGSNVLWVPFQGTANTVTILYKDGIEASKRGSDIGYQTGYNKRNKEILAWAKRKRKMIHREDLLSYLSGRSPPRRTSEQRSVAVNTNPDLVNRLSSESLSSNFTQTSLSEAFDSYDLQPMVNSTSPFFTALGSSGGVLSQNNRRRGQLSEPFAHDGEIMRDGVSRKRSNIGTDMSMDFSPSNKRGRFL